MPSNKFKKYVDYFSLRSDFAKGCVLLILLLLMEFSVMPLTFGPDRRIHDPAVYRLQDTSYMTGDWYTEMAVDSGVYTFYAGLIQAGSWGGFSEEVWRMFLYIICLSVLYVYLLKLARLFASEWYIIPSVVVLHALLVTAMPPAWLYGYYIQVDGGLAPRSVAMALSVAALYYLLVSPRYLPWLLLGGATLIHVSNAFITFVLFIGAWFCMRLWGQIQEDKRLSFEKNSILVKDISCGVFLYFISGGWFLLQVFWLSWYQVSTFSAQKFIWTWIYFRAPYMALPAVPWGYWIVFMFHVVALFCGGWLIRKWYGKQKEYVDLLIIVGFFALCGFGIFYLFAFVFPWLPGFQFYSLRLIYLLYLIGHLFTVLFLVGLLKKMWISKNLRCCSLIEWASSVFLLICLGVTFWLCPVFPGTKFVIGAPKNLQDSLKQIQVPGPRPPESQTALFLVGQRELFLAPPDWNGSRTYVPSVANFKTFGFSKEGLEEWYRRMNRISRGELEDMYNKQSKKEKYKAVKIDWQKNYESLTVEEIKRLSDEYHFKLFLTYKEKEYPFELVVEDKDYRLYRLPSGPLQ